jgi:hypothetical protein
MKADDFRTALNRTLRQAQDAHHTFVDVNSGNLHREIGDYPGTAHRMPVCCEVMRAAMREEDHVLEQPLKGNGASLTVRYRLPR